MDELSAHTQVDPAARKAVLRMFTYGLYAVGVARGDDRNMFTANWLTQASFEPPLITLSVENDSHSIDLIRETGVFTVSVFGDDQKEQAAALGKRWHLRPDKLKDMSHKIGVTGCPYLADSLGYLECAIVDSMRAGDSTLLLAEIVNAEVLREGTPLTMAAAGFRHAG